MQLSYSSHSKLTVCRDLAVCDVTVSIERLETTIMYRMGGSRETNTTVLKLTDIHTLMKLKLTYIDTL